MNTMESNIDKIAVAFALPNGESLVIASICAIIVMSIFSGAVAAFTRRSLGTGLTTALLVFGGWLALSTLIFIPFGIKFFRDAWSIAFGSVSGQAQ